MRANLRSAVLRYMQKQAKAKSKSQQRFFGMVRAVQKGEQEAPSEEIAAAAEDMSKKDVKDFAETRRKGLPEKKKKK